jgi:hypothetical protein
LFKNYAELEHKKDTVFWINREICNTDILIFIKEIKKVFPILLYITNKPWDITLFNKKTAEYTEITTELKEFRYSIDHSKYSFNRIEHFCIKNGLETLIKTFKP